MGLSVPDAVIVGSERSHWGCVFLRKRARVSEYGRERKEGGEIAGRIEKREREREREAQRESQRGRARERGREQRESAPDNVYTPTLNQCKHKALRQAPSRKPETSNLQKRLQWLDTPTRPGEARGEGEQQDYEEVKTEEEAVMGRTGPLPQQRRLWGRAEGRARLECRS